MDIMIMNATTGSATMYKPAELRREALAAVKGRGKLVTYFVQVQVDAPTGATVFLVAQYMQTNGMCSNVTVAI